MPTLVDEEWSDRTAIVTGAASGVGLALSDRLAALGAKVVMVDLPGRCWRGRVTRSPEPSPRMPTGQTINMDAGWLAT